MAQALLDAGVTPIVFGAKDWVHPYFMYIGLTSSVLGPEGFEQVRRGERTLTEPELVAATQLLLDMQPFYQSGFQATDYVTAKAIFANAQGAMQVAGTADFSGYREVNPEADLGFIAWPGPEAGKYATNTGMELLYTVSRFASPEAQEAADPARQLAGHRRGAADGLRPDRAAGPHRDHRIERPDPPGDGGGARPGRHRLVRPAGDEPDDHRGHQRAGRALDRPPHRRAVRRGDAGLDRALGGGGDAGGVGGAAPQPRPPPHPNPSPIAIGEGLFALAGEASRVMPTQHLGRRPRTFAEKSSFLTSSK